MPVRLYLPVYQCECGEIFKKKDTLEKHQKKWKHSSVKEYTVVVWVDRKNNSLKTELISGVATAGYV